jgi:hypothetical protein
MLRWFACMLVLTACGDDDGTTGSTGTSDCWQNSLGSWSVERADMDKLEGIGHGNPALSADGLELYYPALTSAGAPTRVFRATRADRSKAFVGGELLDSWPGLDPVDSPWLSGDELFVNFDRGNGMFELAVSRFQGGAWQPPQALNAEVNAGYADSNPTLTADGLYMSFVRATGIATLNAHLFEARRMDRGSAFAEVREVAIPSIDADDLVLCAALSPDGTRMFFSTTHPHELSSLPPNGLTVWFTERASVDAPWGEPVHVEALDGETTHACASALSADGCELWVQHFVVGGNTEFRIARR